MPHYQDARVPEQMMQAICQQIPTPSVVIDLATALRNVDRMAAYARSHGLKLRPHTKTHKSLRMAHLQLQAGAVGLAVAKTGEADVMLEACRDVLVAYPAADAHRSKRLAELAREATVRVAVDSKDAADALCRAARDVGSQIGVLVDVDVGYHRTGVQSPLDALCLAQYVARSPGLRFDGLFFYPGHICAQPVQQAQDLRRIDGLLAETTDSLLRAGLETPIVSGGSTPTAYQSHLIPVQTEIRPGTYIYNDMNTVRAGHCALDDCAARVVCTVVSTAVPGKAVFDAGSKTLTSDRNMIDPESGHGYVVEYPQAVVSRLTEEHGELDIARCERSPRVGERITIIPNHICPCINLADIVFVKTPDCALEKMHIDARGRTH